MQVPDNFKPFLLIGALIFIVGSYFTSDSTAVTPERVMHIPTALVAKPLCLQRRGSDKNDCKARVEKALIPANLHCTPLMHGLHLCTAAASTKNNDFPCQTEEERLVECLETYLVPQLRLQGFSAKDIALLQLTEESPKRQEGPGGVKGGEGEGEEEEGGPEAREKEEGQEGDGTKEDGGGPDASASGPEVEVKER